MFPRNEGTLDRGIRLILGAVLLWAAFQYPALMEGTWHWVALVVGVAMLFTGVVGHCFAYRPFGINTCAKE